jgi:hypothetical protein
MGERQHITYKPCLRCSGTGAVRSALGWFSTVSTFGISSLSGLDDKESCPRCGGGGQVIDKIYLDAHIPRAPPMPEYKYQPMPPIPPAVGCSSVEVIKPHGCICPPGSETTCKGDDCPRKGE